MKFMGSKNRISKHILPIMLNSRRDGQCWVEPFVGGGNMIDKVKGNRIGADADINVIDALVAIRDSVGLLPKDNKEFTEADYRRLLKKEPYIFSGYAGFAFSYGGRFMEGWCRDGKGRRDYVAEAYRNAIKQNPLLQGVELIHSDYQELNIPKNSIIYCDPPYAGTKKYRVVFNREHFWSWCREQASNGHTVFISEYEAPDDFECIWEKEVVSSLTQDTGSKRAVEKLFVKRK